MHVRLARLDVAPVHRQFRSLPEILDRFRIPARLTQVVEDVHEFSHELLVPYYYSLMHSMYPDLHDDVVNHTQACDFGLLRTGPPRAIGRTGGCTADVPRPILPGRRHLPGHRVAGSSRWRQRNLIAAPIGVEKAWQERVFAVHGTGQDPGSEEHPCQIVR